MIRDTIKQGWRSSGSEGKGRKAGGRLQVSRQNQFVLYQDEHMITHAHFPPPRKIFFTVRLTVCLPLLPYKAPNGEQKMSGERAQANEKMAVIFHPPIPLARSQLITGKHLRLWRQG